MDSTIEENDKILVYNTSLCRICQISNDLDVVDTSSTVKETEQDTYIDIMKFIFSDIFWVEDNLVSVACTICLKKVVQIAEFKKLCLNTNLLRGAIHITIEEPIDPLKVEALTPCHDPTMPLEIEAQTVWTTTQIKIEDVEFVATLECTNVEEDCEKQKKLNETIQTSSSDSNNSTTVLPVVDDIEFKKEAKRKTRCNTPVCDSENSATDELPTKRKRQLRKPDDTLKEVKAVEKKSKSLCCDICGEKFHFMSYLERHIYRHNGTRNYICTVCGRKYVTQVDLGEHLKLHKAEYNYACDICPKKFKSSSNLKMHKNIVHTDPKDFKYLCTECGTRFSGASSYKSHILHHHSKIRDFKCDMCGKDFVKKHDLKIHFLSHSNVRAFKCDLCPAEYKRKDILSNHKSKHHGLGNHKFPVEKMVACTFCGKMFRKDKIARHIRTHTGAKPYSCRLCGSKFTCNSYIRGHVKTKHKIDIAAADFDVKLYYDVSEETTLEDDGVIRSIIGENVKIESE